MADRFNRRNVLATLQAVRGLLLAGLAFLVLTDTVQLWHVLAMVLVQGMADGLMAPSFNGLIYDTLGPRRLLTGLAIALGLAFGPFDFVVAGKVWGLHPGLYGLIVNTTIAIGGSALKVWR